MTIAKRSPLSVLETDRLVVRRITANDAEFILKLLNEPSFIHFIGDKGVRNHEAAVQYIETGPIANYKRFGFGQYLVELKESQEPIGMCGLTKKDALTDPDLGFALIPAFWSTGYAYEAAAAVMAYAKKDLGLTSLVGVTNPDNESSSKLLEKLGFKFERMVRLSEGAAEIKLFALDI